MNLLRVRQSDYNNYYAPIIGNIGGTNYLTLEQWQTATSDDLFSMAEDPDHISLTDYSLMNTSPLIFGGLFMESVPNDINEAERFELPTIGAYEYTGGDLLPPPQPLLPTYHQCAVPTTCRFAWEEVGGAISYTLEYSYSADFSNSVVIEIFPQIQSVQILTQYLTYTGT
jgi:hypothetical protein